MVAKLYLARHGETEWSVSVGGGANPRINGGVFVTDRLRWPVVLLSGRRAPTQVSHCDWTVDPCKRWPSATASGGLRR
jgi:hypothetical protein